MDKQTIEMILSRVHTNGYELKMTIMLKNQTHGEYQIFDKLDNCQFDIVGEALKFERTGQRAGKAYKYISAIAIDQIYSITIEQKEL